MSEYLRAVWIELPRVELASVIGGLLLVALASWWLFRSGPN
jgi:hypothetical protein